MKIRLGTVKFGEDMRRKIYGAQNYGAYGIASHEDCKQFVWDTLRESLNQFAAETAMPKPPTPEEKPARESTPLEDIEL